MALESNIYALWASKQTAKGTPNPAGTKRLIQVAGDIETQRADSSEAFNDLDRFGNQTDFVNTLIGTGTPGIEAQADTAAYLMWLFFGGDTFTAGTPGRHTLTVGTATTGQFDLTVGVGASRSVATGLNVATLTAAQLATALNALPNISAITGTVTCTGGPIQTTPIVINFPGPTSLAVNPFTAASNATTPLVGGTAPTDAVTVAPAFAKHVFTPQVAGGFWSTLMARVGQNVIKRNQHSDVKFSSLAIEGSTSAKVCRITPTVMSLTPGVTYATDPTQVINLANVPLLYTDGSGAFTIDGTVFTGQTQFNITWDEALTAIYGDNVTAFDLQAALAQITVAATIVVDTNGYQEYCRIVYGTATPAAGTPPLETIPAMGSYSCFIDKADGESISIQIPGVHWNPGLAIAPNPQGGVIDLSLSGQMRKVQGQPASTVTALNSDNAAYTT